MWPVSVPLFTVTHIIPPKGRETRSRARQYAAIGDSAEEAIESVRSSEAEANHADPSYPRGCEAGTWSARESKRGYYLYNIYLRK